MPELASNDQVPVAGMSKWEEFAAKSKICPRCRRNFVEMPENARMIAEVIYQSIKKRYRNSSFVRLSPHLASMLAARCQNLFDYVINCPYHRRKQAIC